MSLPPGLKPVRKQEQVAEFSAEPLHREDRMVSAKYTFIDPDTQEIVSVVVKPHILLACGCRVDNPNNIQGICPSCSHLSRKLKWRKKTALPLICRRHSMCLRCRRKRLRELNGGGPLIKCGRLLLKVLLWPFFDAVE